jgi:carboxypeptidase family protein/TonB-dependent receptor-like protein
MNNLRRVRFFAISLAALLCAAGWGQTTGSGTINGTVRDPNQASVPDAMVAIHNVGTGVDRLVQTNVAGLYNAPFLTPGDYEVTVSKAGFTKLLRKDVHLEVGQTLTLDISLTVQATSESITVTGETSVLDTEKTDNSQVVSQIEKDNLPMAGRNWINFQLTAPNVTNDGSSGLASYRGVSGLYNSSNVDGTNNNQAFFSEQKGRTTLPYVYSIDSIQEYQVAVSNYSAELGQAAGGVINAVTKSGSNQLHGDLFYYLRYPDLNALDPINKSKGIYTQPIHQQQQFGGSVGGPIIKDKLFYFMTYDGSRKVNPISYTSSGTYPQACLAAIPAATCAAANAFVVGNLGAFPRFQSQDIAFGKLDYAINQKNEVNASFNFDNFRSPNSYNTAVTSNNNSNSANGKAVTHERNFVGKWSSTITPTTINEFRFQWSRDLETISANAAAPSVTITNFFAYGMPNALPRPAFPDEHRLQFSDVLSKIHGTHTMKFGGDMNFVHELLINLFQGGGVYTYSGTNNFSNWVADVSGINLGDGLTGQHWSTFVQVNDPVTHVGKDDFYNNDYALFAEDSWKARSNLTINYGLRWDLSTIPQPPQPNTATPLTTLYTSTINIPKHQFAPRIGAAWQVTKGTVVRVGYGLFYAKTSNSMFYATRVENGVIQQTFNCTPKACPALKFPDFIFTPPGAAPAAPFTGALNPVVTAFTPPALTQTSRGQVTDFANPRAHEGDVAVEHQLPGNMSVGASYVVSRGMRLPAFIDQNIAPSTTTRTYDITDVTGKTLRSVTVPFYTTRIDPTGPILVGFSDVNSWYNSMVLTFHKKYSHGLEFNFDYTLSKAMDGGEIQGQFGTFNGGGQNFPVDPKNRSLEYARSDLDQRNRFTAALVWNPTWNRISNAALKNVANGWTFSTIFFAGAGQPYSGQINGANPPVGGVLGGLTGGTNNNSGTALSGARVYGDPRNAFTLPGIKDMDFRISRTFAFKERVKFSILGEAFNIFNFTNIYSVNFTQYNYASAGTGACAGHANNCVVQNFTPTGFGAPVTTGTNLSGARQLQVAARLSF